MEVMVCGEFLSSVAHSTLGTSGEDLKIDLIRSVPSTVTLAHVDVYSFSQMRTEDTKHSEAK